MAADSRATFGLTVTSAANSSGGFVYTGTEEKWKLAILSSKQSVCLFFSVWGGRFMTNAMKMYYA
jgi:hypothetical protein